jgi:hypothetical protein
LIAFRATAFFPSSVRGPVERAAFARFAAMFLRVAIARFLFFSAPAHHVADGAVAAEHVKRLVLCAALDGLFLQVLGLIFHLQFLRLHDARAQVRSKQIPPKH